MRTWKYRVKIMRKMVMQKKENQRDVLDPDGRVLGPVGLQHHQAGVASLEATLARELRQQVGWNRDVDLRKRRGRGSVEGKAHARPNSNTTGADASPGTSPRRSVRCARIAS